MTISYGMATQAFDGTINNSTNTNMWVSQLIDGGIYGTWIGYQFSTPHPVYQVQFYNGCSGEIPYTILVQYHDGSRWIDTQTFAVTSRSDYGRNTFILSKDFGAHTSWRIFANDYGSGSGKYWMVSELQFMSNIAEPIINLATIHKLEIYGNPYDCTTPVVFEAIDADTINEFENAYEIENNYIISPDDGKQIVDYYLYRHKNNLSYISANTIGIPQLDLLDRITITDLSSGSGIDFDFIVTSIKHSIKKDGFKTNLQLESLIPPWVYDPARVDARFYNIGINAISPYRYTNPPIPTNINLTESTYVQNSGEVVTEVQVTFKPAQYSYYSHTSVQISQSVINNEVIWKDIGNSVEGNCIIHNLKVGATYYVRLRTVSVNGLTSDWTSMQITTSGKDSPPGDVISFNITQSGAVLTASIVAPSDPDIRNYEIRLGSSWENSALMKVFSDVQTTFLAPQEGVQSFWIKAVDNSGGYSLNALKCTISIYGLPITNIVSETIEDIDAWIATGMYQNPMMADGWVIDTNEIVGDTGFFADIFEGGSTLVTSSTILFPPIDLGPNIIADGYFYVDPWGVVKINTTKTVGDYEFFFDMFGDSIMYVVPQYKLSTSMNIDIDYVQKPEIYINIQFRNSIDGVSWTEWVDLINHHFFGRYIQLRLFPGSLDNKTNIAIYGADIKIDVPDLEENIENRVILNEKTHFNFSQRFYTAPNSISLWTMDSNGKMCVWRMTNKTVGGFDLELVDKDDNLISGTLVRAIIRGY